MSIQDGLASGPLVMMTLGRFQFGIRTAAYQELSRSTEWRWPAQERFMRGQALQYVGPGGDTISLPGIIYPEWRGGVGQVDAMRALAGQGEPLTLIDGTGIVWGEWVIEKVDERQGVFAAAGIPRKQEFTVSLRRFDDDDLGGSAFSGSVASSIGLPTADADGIGGLIGSTVSKAAGLASSLSTSLDQVTAVASQIGGTVNSVLTPINRAMNVATGLKNAAMDAKALLGGGANAIARASSLTQLLNSASSAVANASQAGGSLRRSLASLQGLGTVPAPAIGAVQSAMVNVNKLTVAATQTQAQAAILIKNLNA